MGISIGGWKRFSTTIDCHQSMYIILLLLHVFYYLNIYYTYYNSYICADIDYLEMQFRLFIYKLSRNLYSIHAYCIHAYVKL